MIKLFSHRGYFQKGARQNSLEALNQAFDLDYHGIEFDIWYLDDELILAHDKPSPEEIPTLNRFADFLYYENQIDYWLDFKNLNLDNSRLVLTKVKNDLDKYKVSLNNVYFAPYVTNYKLAYEIFVIIKSIFGPKARTVLVCDKEDQIDDIEQIIKKDKVRYLSIYYKLINNDLIKQFDDTTLFAWTVNQENDLAKLVDFGVKNFATDKILPNNLISNS